MPSWLSAVGSGAPDAPDYFWTSGPATAEPIVEVEYTPLPEVGDTINVQFATDSGFAAPEFDIEDVLSAAEVFAGQSAPTITLTDGVWHTRARYKKVSAVLYSLWSITISQTMNVP